MAANRERPVIILRPVKRVAAGHHGGAWKVAYADFVTAMMAFFLVMWIVGITDKQQRAAISEYFKNPSAVVGQSLKPAPGANGPGGAADRLIPTTSAVAVLLCRMPVTPIPARSAAKRLRSDTRSTWRNSAPKTRCTPVRTMRVPHSSSAAAPSSSIRMSWAVGSYIVTIRGAAVEARQLVIGGPESTRLDQRWPKVLLFRIIRPNCQRIVATRTSENRDRPRLAGFRHTSRRPPHLA